MLTLTFKLQYRIIVIAILLFWILSVPWHLERWSDRISPWCANPTQIDLQSLHLAFMIFDKGVAWVQDDIQVINICNRPHSGPTRGLFSLQKLQSNKGGRRGWIFLLKGGRLVRRFWHYPPRSWPDTSCKNSRTLLIEDQGIKGNFLYALEYA